MRLIHNFPHSAETRHWPDNYEDLSYIVEDGDDATLHVDYTDKHFVRPMAPVNPDEQRGAYQSREAYQRKQNR